MLSELELAGMVKFPPAAPDVHPASLHQVTVPVELETAVNACPPGPALTELPNGSWSWTVITPAAPEHTPAVTVREGVRKPNLPAPALMTLNAELVAPASGADEAVRV